MRQSVKDDLLFTTDSLEHLFKVYPKLTIEEKVDAGAKIRAIMKNAEKLDDLIKDDIKAKRNGEDGEVLGDAFKATLSGIPGERFDAKAFKADDPKTYKKYLVDASKVRITFATR
jgi:hypothetical protein